MSGARSVGTILGIVAILASTMLSGGAANAGRVLSSVQRASSRSIDPFAALVTEASRRFGVPEYWISAVLRVESGGKWQARSQKGAIGLMQIMPRTWIELRDRYGLGADPYDPRDNILAGAAYIRELHDRYGTQGFLAAYNAGPRRYERHLATGRPLPDETRMYVATLAPLIEERQAAGKNVGVAMSPTWAGSPLFAMPRKHSSSIDWSLRGVHPVRQWSAGGAGDLSAPVPPSGSLFVDLASKGRPR
jgi:membrane-bound lytic murein transglycosylase B